MAVLNIPDRDYAVLRKLSELTEPQFADLIKGLGEIRASFSVESFCNRLSATVASIPKEDADGFVGLLCGLYPVMENRQKSSQNVASDIKETIQETKRLGFTAERTSIVETRMQRLLSIGKAIAVTAKANDVATEHQNVFCGAKIYSDIRPIISASADSIAGAVVLHNLNISYHQGRIHKEFFVALDSSEINDLKEAIERAEKEAKQLQSLINKSGVDYLE